jgi:hypothetical protein
MAQHKMMRKFSGLSRPLAPRRLVRIDFTADVNIQYDMVLSAIATVESLCRNTNFKVGMARRQAAFSPLRLGPNHA